MPKLAVIRSFFSVILKLQFWATCCRARTGIILLNIAHPYRVIICCGWCACARAELNCLFCTYAVAFCRKRSGTCSIEIWQLRARVDSFQRCTE